MQYIYLYPTCVTVKGYSRSILQDLQQMKYFFIPNFLEETLQKTTGKTVMELREAIGNDELYNEYITFLTEQNVVYFSENKIDFSMLPLEYSYPAKISNGIIICSAKVIDNFKHIIESLTFLGCEHLQVYYTTCESKKSITSLLAFFEDTRIRSIELIINNITGFESIESVKAFFAKYHRLFKLIISGASHTQKVFVDPFNQKHIFYSQNQISYNDCGCIHPLFFKNNLSFYVEGLSFNTCLNRKVCVDANGDIKNCPSVSQNFGNIFKNSLEEIIDNDEFKKYWKINKNNIDICRDCEFRYMCPDCRVFLKKDYTNSQPLKCTYNPYVCKWQGEDGYVPVDECGEYNDFEEFSTVGEKILQLNKQIWGE